MKLNILYVLLAAAVLCLLTAFTAGAVPVSADASDNTTQVFLQNWGHSGGQSCATPWGNSVWHPSQKG
jgi:hypothetical protein